MRTVLKGRLRDDGLEAHYPSAPFPFLLEPIVGAPGEIVHEREQFMNGLVRERVLRVRQGMPEFVVLDVIWHG